MRRWMPHILRQKLNLYCGDFNSNVGSLLLRVHRFPLPSAFWLPAKAERGDSALCACRADDGVKCWELLGGRRVAKLG